MFIDIVTMSEQQRADTIIEESIEEVISEVDGSIPSTESPSARDAPRKRGKKVQSKKSKWTTPELCQNEQCVKDREEYEKSDWEHLEEVTKLEEEISALKKEVEFLKSVVESFTQMTLGKKARR